MQSPQNLSATPVIRPISPDDAASLRTLYALSLRNNPNGFVQDPTFHGDIMERAQKYQQDNGEMLGLFNPDGALIGFGGLKNKGEGRVELCNLHLHPDYHGQGLGKRLSQALIEDAENFGYGTVELHVTATQQAAISLYWHLGFKETRRQVYDMPQGSFDTVFMELVL